MIKKMPSNLLDLLTSNSLPSWILGKKLMKKKISTKKEIPRRKIKKKFLEKRWVVRDDDVEESREAWWDMRCVVFSVICESRVCPFCKKSNITHTHQPTNNHKMCAPKIHLSATRWNTSKRAFSVFFCSKLWLVVNGNVTTHDCQYVECT